MRYEKGHKEETRRRILAAASKRFRKEGIAAVGLAGLMADAGLTHGGFYSHFGAKEDLVREALAVALDASRAALAREAAEHGGLPAIVRAYLAPRHRDRPEHGCAIAALAAEVARHPTPTRAALAHHAEALIDLIAAQLPGHEPHAAHTAATAILAVMMGALQLARVTPDPARADEILESGVAAALALARAVPSAPATG
jgi:TetR/AcrR family transcriptional regulator, transcriptional repressor for nem operon